MRSFFPLSARVSSGSSFAVSVAAYLLLSLATGFILGFFTGVPLIGGIIGFISQLIDLYCWGGIVVSILILAKII